MSAQAARRGLLLVLLVYLVAGTIYSLLCPLGEAPDEMAHFQYLRHVTEQRRLPRSDEDRAAAGIKSHEPPLYYGLLGLATAWLDVGPLPRLKMLDPERYPRHSLPDEVLINFALLHTADERWPFRGVVLVWHLARLGSLTLMAATLGVLFAVVRQVCPRHPEVALLATVVAGLSPQFIYIGSSLNNDALAALLGALLVWLLVRLAQGDLRWHQFLLLGLILGLARLSKFYMLAMLPVVALILLVLAWRRRQPRYAVGLLPALALSFAIPAPWLLYIQPAGPEATRGLEPFWRLFDVVHLERWFGTGGEGQAGSGILAIGRALAGMLRLQPQQWALTLFKSFWAYFGAMTVRAPRPVYAVVAILTGLSVLGWLHILCARLRRRATVLADCQELWIPGLQALAFLAAEAVFYGVLKRLPDTAQGRHLYPALAGIALFLALGWWGLWRPLASAQATAGLAVLLLGLSGYCLPTVLRSVHKPLLPVRSTAWPDAPVQTPAVPVGDGLLLEGSRWAVSDGRLAGTLFWQASQPPANEAVIILELADQAGTVDAVWAGHPGGSRYPTQAWAAGDRVRQQVQWPLSQPLPAGPHVVRLRVLREGQQVASLQLASIELPAAKAAPLSSGTGQPECLIHGLEQTAAHLRDTVLITWPGRRLQGLVRSDGAVWQPLAQTARGDQVALVVDARVTPGGYTVQTAGPLPAGQTPVTVTVAGRQRAFDPPAGLQPVGAIFSETVELIGYALQADSAATVVPGQTVHLRLVWRAQQRIGQHYTVFTHLVDEQGRLWGQHDKLPGQEYSTLFWAPGEVVEDDYSLPVDPVAPSGTYRLVAGLYQALSGARAPIRGAQGRLLGDQLVLAEIEVVAR